MVDVATRSGTDAVLRAVVLSAISRFISENNDNDLVTPSVLCRGLAIYGHTDLGGTPPPAPSTPRAHIPDGQTALRRLGMSRGDVLALWRSAVDCDGVRATLPEPVLAELIPRTFWPAAEALVAEGPS